jgi:hypothetical protein
MDGKQAELNLLYQKERKRKKKKKEKKQIVIGFAKPRNA